MRYSVYKSLITVNESLIEALNHVKSTGNFSLIPDCAYGLLSIEEVILKNMDSILDKEIVECLNNLKELFTEIADMITNNELADEKIHDAFKKTEDLKNKMKSGISYKYRVIFFAELASKWDSLDSLYRAYKAREDCEVDVIIAPIFRAVRYPDDSVKSNVIYEDFLTSMGIHHIPFKEYDIKKDMPDLVFTSQPYESVTVEMFWAENIAPYTRLVYVPYFSTIYINSKEEAYTQCQMDMHKKAWRIACQSEAYKKTLINYAPDLEKKLISLGLPKFDWITNLDERKIDFPDKWNKLKDKKRVLLNVHYNVKDLELFFSEIRERMRTYENTDIGFIIRFHPMTETMFKVYYTDYEKKWENLLSDIENSSNFVVDNNEFYDASFKYSEVLISTGSSIIGQYLLTGKPIILFGYVGQYPDSTENPNVFLEYSKLYGTVSVINKEAINTEKETLEKIFSGDDYKNEERMEMKSRFAPICDGKIGERFAEQLINELKVEENI